MARETACGASEPADHRWREDLDLIAALRLEAYRFSIAWPRVRPDGRGALNRKGVEFYRRLASDMRERDIDPVATLYHADLPAALQDRGGWASRETAARFGDHAQHMADALGDVVGNWITHNEPWGRRLRRARRGDEGPGLRDWATALQVAHHLLASHGLAVQALRASRPDATVGSRSTSRPCAPPRLRTPTPRRHAARTGTSPLVPRPAAARRYPDDLVALFEQRVGPFELRPGDLETIATPIDLLGINYYHPDCVRAAPAREPQRLEHITPPSPPSPLGWQIDPHGLRDLLARLARDYGRRPIWITENGIPDEADIPPGQALEDQPRGERSA